MKEECCWNEKRITSSLPIYQAGGLFEKSVLYKRYIFILRSESGWYIICTPRIERRILKSIRIGEQHSNKVNQRSKYIWQRRTGWKYFLVFVFVHKRRCYLWITSKVNIWKGVVDWCNTFITYSFASLSTRSFFT